MVSLAGKVKVWIYTQFNTHAIYVLRVIHITKEHFQSFDSSYLGIKKSVRDKLLMKQNIGWSLLLVCVGIVLANGHAQAHFFDP